MARRPAQKRSSTPFPDTQVERSIGAAHIDDAEWQLIANDIRNCIYAADNATQTLRDNLQIYNRIYELYSEPRNEPFFGASSVFLPVAVAKLDSLMAQVAAKVFVPDICVITGRGPQPELDAYDVQRWYNDEFRRDRIDLTTRLGESLDVLFYGLLEGTSILEVTWAYEEEMQFYDVEVPKQGDDESFTMGDDGEFETEDQEVQKILEIDEAVWRCVQLKDFRLVPTESKTVAQSVARGRALWLYESDLRAMIADGLLKEEWVEKLLVYNPSGQSDVASDRDGYWDKTAGGQIQIGQGQGPMASTQFKNRGPFKVWYYDSDQFDMNHDEVCEKHNIFWWAELSNYLLGWVPSKRISQRVNFFSFCPLPRKNSFFGFSLLEREAPINSEVNTIVNNVNDYVTLSLKGPMLANSVNESKDDDYTWELGKRWYVEDVTNAFKPLEYGDPNVVIMAMQQLQVFNSFADQIAGQSAPQTGGQTTGRKSATEIKEMVAGSGTRSDLIALFLRLTLRRALQYTHELNCQNLPDQPPPDSAQPPKKMLQQNFVLDVAGTGDPIDSATYLQEYLAFHQLMSQDPDIQQDAEKRFALKQQLGKVFKIESLEAIIGTAQEATQRKQQEEQVAQQKMQLEQQMAQSEIAKNLKGTPEEAAQAKQQGQPQPLDQQTQLAEKAMGSAEQASQNGAAQQNGAGATVGAGAAGA